MAIEASAVACSASACTSHKPPLDPTLRGARRCPSEHTRSEHKLLLGGLLGASSFLVGPFKSATATRKLVNCLKPKTLNSGPRGRGDKNASFRQQGTLAAQLPVFWVPGLSTIYRYYIGTKEQLPIILVTGLLGEFQAPHHLSALALGTESCTSVGPEHFASLNPISQLPPRGKNNNDPKKKTCCCYLLQCQPRKAHKSRVVRSLRAAPGVGQVGVFGASRTGRELRNP